jgi:hypothetical protein
MMCKTNFSNIIAKCKEFDVLVCNKVLSDLDISQYSESQEVYEPRVTNWSHVWLRVARVAVLLLEFRQ